MPLSTPIDEGQPGYTSYATATYTTFNGSNLSTAGRLLIRSDVTGEIIDEPIWYSGTNIHDKTAVYSPNTSFVQGALQIVNPIGYHDKVPSQVLQDLLKHQAQVGRGIVRIFPSGDGTPNQWTRSPASGGHYDKVNENTRNPNANTLFTVTAGQQELLNHYNQCPSNLDRVREIRVNMWAMTSTGTDAGMNVKVEVYANAILQHTVPLYFCLPSDAALHFWSMKIEGLNIARVDAQLMSAMITADRGYVGASPSPLWVLQTFDMDMYYETTDLELVDVSTFDDQDTYFSTQTVPYVLDGDLYGNTYKFRDAIMEALRHAPELFIYLSYDGKLSLGRIGPYSAEASPYLIGPAHGNFESLKASTYDERLGNVVETKFHSTCGNHNAQAEAIEDPDNLLNNKKWEDKNNDPDVEQPIVPERPLIRDKDLATVFTSNLMEMFGTVVDSVEVNMKWHALRVEVGQIVALDVPKKGFDEKKMLVVSRSFNLDSMSGSVLLYDLELT